MDPLKEIAKNKVLRDALEGFFTETLKEMVIDRAFNGQEVKDIAEARKVIEKGFAKLDKRYEKKKIITNNST